MSLAEFIQLQAQSNYFPNENLLLQNPSGVSIQSSTKARYDQREGKRPPLKMNTKVFSPSILPQQPSSSGMQEVPCSR